MKQVLGLLEAGGCSGGAESAFYGGIAMIFKTVGNKSDPAILFFHAMGVTGDSSIPVAEFLKDQYYCILPTSTVYCAGQKYVSKLDEAEQITEFLKDQGIQSLCLVVASSLGADLALAFLTQSGIPTEHVFFDGGQFAKIPAPVRHLMTPFLYLAIRSLYWSQGKTLKKILWCDDESIRPYFIAAGKNLTYGNLYRQLSDSLLNTPFPPLPQQLQENSFWEFGEIEDHFKYREDVKKSYPFGNFPVFAQYNHMQYQIRDPQGFARMLQSVITRRALPELPFVRK